MALLWHCDSMNVVVQTGRGVVCGLQLVGVHLQGRVKV